MLVLAIKEGIIHIEFVPLTYILDLQLLIAAALAQV
jgi:hypothetical protein